MNGQDSNISMGARDSDFGDGPMGQEFRLRLVLPNAVRLGQGEVVLADTERREGVRFPATGGRGQKRVGTLLDARKVHDRVCPKCREAQLKNSTSR